jgi:hypothetical protein
MLADQVEQLARRLEAASEPVASADALGADESWREEEHEGGVGSWLRRTFGLEPAEAEPDEAEDYPGR